MRRQILMLITEYGEGGAARVMAAHSQDISQYHDVTECTFESHPGPVYATGNPTLALGVPPSNSLIESIVNLCKRILRLRRVMKSGAFHTCISHMEGANYVNAFCPGPWRKILVVHGPIENDPNYTGLKGWLRARVLIPLACRIADQVVVVSDAIRKDYLRRGIPSCKLVSLPNYFQADSLEALTQEAIPEEFNDFFSNYRVICNLARLSQQKNQHSLLRLFAQLRQIGSYKLLLLGDGELRDELADYAQSLGLAVQVGFHRNPNESDVVFLGFQSNPFAYLARSSLCLLTSHYEGFPLALGEAMCCKVPVASVDCPTGPRQMLDSEQIEGLPWVGEYGVLLNRLEGDSPQAKYHDCAQVLHQFLSDHTQVRRVTEKAYQRARQLYSRETILPSLLNLPGLSGP